MRIVMTEIGSITTVVQMTVVRDAGTELSGAVTRTATMATGSTPMVVRIVVSQQGAGIKFDGTVMRIVTTAIRQTPMAVGIIVGSRFAGTDLSGAVMKNATTAIRQTPMTVPLPGRLSWVVVGHAVETALSGQVMRYVTTAIRQTPISARIVVSGPVAGIDLSRAVIVRFATTGTLYREMGATTCV